jgi:outer membrane receptor protein involved in Fe transport
VETVEVTVTRLPEVPSAVPAALEVVPGQELRDRGAADLRSALALATGVDIAQGGDSGPASFVPEFWGLKEFDAFLLVVDGVPSGGAFNPALSTLNLSDVDRIEVVRGAAPVMYGATSFVGVIHVVHTPAGKTERRATASIGNFGSGGAGFNTRLPRWSGWDSSLNLDAAREGFKDERTGFTRGHALWRNERAAGAGRFRFDVDLGAVNQDPASPHVREGAALSTQTPLDANYNPQGAYLDNRRGTLSLSYDRPLGARDGSSAWTTTLSASRASHGIFRGFLSEVANLSPNARGYREDIDLTDVYFDSHLAKNPSPEVRIVAGVDHLLGVGNAKGAAFTYFAPLGGLVAASVREPAALDQTITDVRNFTGLYGFLEWHPTPRVRLEGGLRLNHTAEEHGMNEEPGKVDTGEDKTSHTRLSGGAGLMLTAWEKGTDHVRFFAAYKNTFKPAAIDFGIGETEPAGEGLLKPETALSYEGGLKTRFLEGRFSFEASAFQMDFENLVIARTLNGLPSLTNSGKQRFRGAEFGAAAWLPANFSVRASYSFHDAKFTDFVFEFDPGVPTQLAGKRLETSPRRLASLGLLYAPPQGFIASFEYGNVGDRYLNKRNTALAPSYRTVSAFAGYRSGKWEVRISGRNLGDERAPVAESELGDAQYYRLNARRIDAILALKF